MVSDDQIMKTQTCFLQEMVQKERIQPSTVDLVHLVPFCLSLLRRADAETSHSEGKSKVQNKIIVF